MSYMLLIIEPEGQRQVRGVEAGKQVYQRMLDFAAELQARGVLVATQSLAGTAEGVRLQVREGRRSIVDGPFAETKEMVGGFFLLNVATRDEAIRIAAECPAAEWATVEVRGLAPCYEST
ncbi:YciI family protein [Aquabacterium sp.]|uniref:YciI family protein n=1 Tax=Aquabacterium sp. TaxID=1872578 RepID=UPI002C1197EC|nr:YciI family protein [Aquabacterium sp.]HSW07639.1 YciI family protein [Aquabacterium sp.]